MRNLLLGIAGIGFLFLLSCNKIDGKGPAVSQTRAIDGFSGIHLNLNAEVIVKQSPDYSVELVGQENILDHIKTRVIDRSLKITSEDKISLRNYTKVKVYVSMPDISSLYVNGSGDITTSAISATDIDLDINGSGNITLRTLNADHINSKINGSGDINIEEGSTRKAHYKISGSGNIMAIQVPANAVEVNISGSGDAFVHAIEKLDVSISGSGTVKYKGTPVINTNISGSGKVSKYD